MDYDELYHTFLDAQASLKQLDDGVIKHGSSDYEEVVRSTAQKFNQCLQITDVLGLFSPNEEVEDVQTHLLKYILIPYYLAQTYQKVVHLESRLSALKASKALFLNFLDNCTSLGLTTKKEIEIYTCKRSLTPAELRTEKIERSRAKTMLESQLEFIKTRYSLIPFSETRRAVRTGEEDDVHENEREYYVKLIELCIKLALDELSILDREIEVLEHMTAGGGDASGPCDSYGSAWKGIMTPEGPIKTFVIDKKLQIRKAVFKPHWTQPTMSVEEAGELEYRIAREQAKQQANFVKKDRKDEDEEAADRKAREWDDWKDEHPKGSGNTGSKGYIY